jgi:transcriptional regulator with XRE-family HTH domain
MTSSAALINRARSEAGLTQGQLARRLGVTQAAVARLESPAANPTIATLQRVLRAAGHELELRLGRPEPSVDRTLLIEALRLQPAERLAAAERLQAEAEEFAAAGRRAREK